MSEQTQKDSVADAKLDKSEDEWRAELAPEEYHVLREKGTERAFTGKYWDLKDDGMYLCAACGEPLFSSETKYDSGSGWPSFYQPADSDSVNELADHSHGMVRTEVVCKKCESQIGRAHV